MDKVSRVGGVASPEVLKVLEWVKKSQIVEEWHEGANFYRKYASGFVEQGGLSPSPTDNTNVAVTLHVPFSSADYFVFSNYLYSYYTEKSYGYVNGQTTNGFNVFSFDTSFYWYACGY